MNEYKNGTYVGERALYGIEDASIENSVFEDGESPLKECKRLAVRGCTFRYKYPLWYGKDIVCEDCVFEEMSRSGIWYTENITLSHCTVFAPKLFRRAKGVKVIDTDLPNAQEMAWGTDGLLLKNVHAVGDYFGFNARNVEADNFTLDGNYCFDGGKDIVLRNSTLASKDSFWNSENVLVENCHIVGEYIGWNSKNLTFKNCVIESHQGFCYIEGLNLIDCELIDTDLSFELCSNVNAKIKGKIHSVKNPISGRIEADSIGELILDPSRIDPSKTEIIVKE